VETLCKDTTGKGRFLVSMTLEFGVHNKSLKRSLHNIFTFKEQLYLLRMYKTLHSKETTLKNKYITNKYY